MALFETERLDYDVQTLRAVFLVFELNPPPSPLLANIGKDSILRNTGRRMTMWDDREVAIIAVLAKKDGGWGVEIISTPAENHENSYLACSTTVDAMSDVDRSSYVLKKT
jgi:hypothetical protein